MRKGNIGKALAGTAGVLLVAAAGAPGAAAVAGSEDSGDVQATVRKTVLQTGSATGELSSNRMYTQVSAVGSGTKTVTVPVGTTSNRNLNQFGAFPMDGDSIVFDLNVDGSVEQRSLTEVDIQPIVVSVRVLLDGVEVQPADLVGANGVVDVEYTVKNTTVHTEEVTFQNAAGEDVTQTIEVADPFVGSLDVTLPKGFNEVTAPGATVAGNGQNGTQLGYTFVLFPPLGEPMATVGYQARISNGQMPAAEFAFLPIQPFDNSTIASTYEAYQGGAETGATIFGAGQQIGENLLKLQAGAGQLVVGLGQLSAGAQELNSGLAGTAAPGAAQLADGADQLSAGLNELNSNVPALSDGVEQLNDGADQLNDGAQQLSSGLNKQILPGAEQVADGNAELAAGLAKLQAGIYTLSGKVGELPATVAASLEKNAEYQQLLATLTKIIAGIGTPADTAKTTIEGGLNNIKWGLRYPGTNDCALALAGGTPTKCGAMDAVQLVASQLATGAADLNQLKAVITSLNTALGAAACPSMTPPPAPASPPATPCDLIGTLYYGLFGAPPAPPGAQAKVVAASNALISTYHAVDADMIPGVQQLQRILYNPADGSACDPSKTDPTDPKYCGIAQALSLVKAGIPTLVSKLAASIQASFTEGIGTAPVNPATCSPTTLTCASAQLTAGATKLATGASSLADGIGTAAAGSKTLAGGTEQLADGTEELNSKVPTLASGVEQLDAGGEQLADGANQLADGLGAAADGSGQIADGLGQAEPGAGKIEDGAGQLKEQGSDQLEASGKEAQAQYASNVAILQAQQLLGEQGAGIPFGTATGTDTVTTAAYQLQLAGIAADTENNAMRFGLGAAFIAGAAGAAYAARRKLTA